MSLDDRVETQEISPKTEAGRKLVRWAEGLENFSKENVSAGEAITVLGGLAAVGAGAILFSNGIHLPETELRYIFGGTGSVEHGDVLSLARGIVHSSESTDVYARALGGDYVKLAFSSEVRGQLVDSLLGIEKFKSLKDGAGATFFLAGMGMTALTSMGEKATSMKRSTSLLPGVAKALASLGKIL